MTLRDLTEKEQQVIEAFNTQHPELGLIAESNIRSSATGWAEIIDIAQEAELSKFYSMAMRLYKGGYFISSQSLLN